MKKNTASKNDGGGIKKGGGATAGCRGDLISWDDCPVWQRNEKERQKREKVVWLVFPGEWARGGRDINGPIARCESHPPHWFSKIRSLEEEDGRLDDKIKGEDSI